MPKLLQDLHSRVAPASCLAIKDKLPKGEQRPQQALEQKSPQRKEPVSTVALIARLAFALQEWIGLIGKESFTEYQTAWQLC